MSVGSESRNEFEENAKMVIISEMLKEAGKEAKLANPHHFSFPSVFLLQ